VFDFTVRENRVVAIEMVADPERLGELDMSIVSD